MQERFTEFQVHTDSAGWEMVIACNRLRAFLREHQRSRIHLEDEIWQIIDRYWATTKSYRPHDRESSSTSILGIKARPLSVAFSRPDRSIPIKPSGLVAEIANGNVREMP